MNKDDLIISLKFDDIENTTQDNITNYKLIRDKTFYAFESLNNIISISLLEYKDKYDYNLETAYIIKKMFPIFNLYDGEFVIWNVIKNLLSNDIEDILKKLYEKDTKSNDQIISFESHFRFDNFELDRLNTIPKFSVYSLEIANLIIDDYKLVERLNSEEKIYFNAILKRYRSKAFYYLNDHLYQFNIPNIKSTLFQDPIVFKRINQSSPLEITIQFVGIIGSICALILMLGWTRNYFKHSKIDLKNKEMAQEACNIILEKLRNDKIDVTPEVLEKFIENTQIKTIDIPNIMSIKIDS